MNRNALVVNDLQLSYAESRPGSKKTIFFIHGNSGSVNCWKNQLDDPLFAGYRLVAVDLPGHGNSSASLKPEQDYSIPGMAKILADTIIKMNPGDQYILAGFSLGTNIVAEMLAYLKPSGIVLIASSVIGGEYTLQQAFQDAVDSVVFFSDDADDARIINAMRNSFYHHDEDTLDMIFNDYKAVMRGFRPTMIKTYMDGEINDEIALLRDIKVPVLVVFGEEEKFANPGYLDALPFATWGNKVFKLPGAGHSSHIDQPELFNKLLHQYCVSIFGN